MSRTLPTTKTVTICCTIWSKQRLLASEDQYSSLVSGVSGRLSGGIIWRALIFTITDERMSLVCQHRGHYSESKVSDMHMYSCAVPVPSDEMRMRPETCIICNWYHSLMVSALPMEAHNGPFLRFSASYSAFWWWQNGDSECHLGRNKKNDGTFHLLVRKLALKALDTACTHVPVHGVADTTEDKKIPFKLNIVSFWAFKVSETIDKSKNVYCMTNLVACVSDYQRLLNTI